MVELKKCPLCDHFRFLSIQGYDYKAGPEIFEFIGHPGTKSCWSICKRCGLVFQNPRPNTNDIINIYSSGIYRQGRTYSEDFFKSRYERPLEQLSWLKQNADIPSSPRILDIGAGHGGAVKAFADAGAFAEGIELDPSLCVSAKERFGVTLINGDFLEHPFEENSYDIIYSAHCHEHFVDFSAVNQKIHRLLKPTGFFLIIVPTFRFAALNGREFINVFHNSMFTGKSLRNIFSKDDFNTVAISYPFRHSVPEAWGIATPAKHEDVPKKIDRDNAVLVYLEIRCFCEIIECFYRTTAGIKRIIKSILRVLGIKV